MASQNYATAAERVGAIKGEILKHAIPTEVLGITGNMHPMPEHQSDTIIFRRWLPFGGATTSATTINQWSVTAAGHETQEGVTPNADTIAPQDISVTVKQYSCLYQYSDKTARLYEDDIPAEMKKQTGQRMGLVREMIRYGALKGATNKFYAGGTSRATVDEAISINVLRRVSRSVLGNGGEMVTQILAPSANYATAPVEAAMLVFCSTDGEADIRALPGFVKVAEYGQRKPVHAMEIGSVDNFRFIISRHLTAVADAGAAVGSTGLYSTTGSNIDVYPFIVVAENAWGDVALRGSKSFEVTDIPHTVKDKSDPHGQRGYIGAQFWSAAFVQNDGWMSVVECGVSTLT